jgi:hypothetical protein
MNRYVSSTFPINKLSFDFKDYPHDAMYSMQLRFTQLMTDMLPVSSSIHQII